MLVIYTHAVCDLTHWQMMNYNMSNVYWEFTATHEVTEFLIYLCNTYNPEVTEVTCIIIFHSEKESRNESLYISPTRGCYIYTVLGGGLVTLREKGRGIWVGWCWVH